jgi:hypothetical protein
VLARLLASNQPASKRESGSTSSELLLGNHLGILAAVCAHLPFVARPVAKPLGQRMALDAIAFLISRDAGPIAATRRDTRLHDVARLSAANDGAVPCVPERARRCRLDGSARL